MKKILLILFCVFLISCKSTQNEFFIVEDKILNICIKEKGGKCIDLNKKEIKKLVNLLNNSEEINHKDFTSKFELIIQMKDEVVKINTVNSIFRFDHSNKETYLIKEKNYFLDLWNKKSHNL